MTACSSRRLAIQLLPCLHAVLLPKVAQLSDPLCKTRSTLIIMVNASVSNRPVHPSNFYGGSTPHRSEVRLGTMIDELSPECHEHPTLTDHVVRLRISTPDIAADAVAMRSNSDAVLPSAHVVLRRAACLIAPTKRLLTSRRGMYHTSLTAFPCPRSRTAFQRIEAVVATHGRVFCLPPGGRLP